MVLCLALFRRLIFQEIGQQIKEMRLPFIFRIILLVCLTATLALSISLSKHGCQEKCGNVTIPYPFGIGARCSANSSFTVTCKNSTNPPIPILTSINRQVLKIFLQGAIIVNQSVSPLNCSDDSRPHTLPISLLGTPFTISSQYNTFVNPGCHKTVWLFTNRTTIGGGCTAFCERNSTDTSCNGINCCQATIPKRLQELQYTFEVTQPSNDGFCGYAFPVDKKWLQQDYKNHKGLQNNLSSPHNNFGFVPLVLEWEAYNDLDDLYIGVTCGKRIGYGSLFSKLCNDPYNFQRPQWRYYDSFLYRFCSSLSKYSSTDSSVTLNYDEYRSTSSPSIYSSDSSVILSDEYDYQSTSRYCSCDRGYEGNPYLSRGCSVIDECSNATLTGGSCPAGYCVNTAQGFTCEYPPDYYSSNGDYNSSGRLQTQVKTAFTVIGSVIGTLILLYGTWRSGNFLRKVIKAIRKYKFYKRNGGLLLEQHLTSTENGLERTKLFTSKELTQATDHYNENRILGRGGQGTVYKGMLTDGKIVAVKKSKKVDEGDLEVFINKVVILSQINHRNVVKLLGCCLETEVPLLVYEFIPNGTLFHHIHEPNEDLPLTWEMRVRIATEVAGALAYLHCASSAPIYHRDIKSTNILLDDKYRAKVSDFGTSRSVAIDQTHVTTRVLGTFGYLDPEYFQSSQFTEKSDVYSFGVVMVELLTGEKAVTAVRAESGKSLATHFLHTMEENQLFDIIDARVLREGKPEEIVTIAELARRCLHLNGKRRPTMKDVAVDLEGIQRGINEGLVSMQCRDHSTDDHSVDVPDESSDFSSISASTYMDTGNGYTSEAET